MIKIRSAWKWEKTNVDVWSEGFFNHPSRKRTFLFSGLKIPLETHFLQEMFQPIWAVKVTRYQCWPRYESIPMGVSNLAGTGVWWPYLAAMCDVTGKGKNGTRKYPPNLLFSGKKNTLDDSGPLPKCAQKKIATHFGHKKITSRFFFVHGNGICLMSYRLHRLAHAELTG